MDPEELLGRAPRRLAVSSEQPDLRYEIDDGLIAIHGGTEEKVTRGVQPADGIAVAPATEARALPPERGTIGPVYRRAPGGGVVVPTGRVLVRFAEGEEADRHRDELAEAGFELDEVLSYAPHAAWVRARSGDIADCLAGLDRLTAQAGVEHVEPQMLGEVARRD